MQALPIYLDKLFNEYVAIILSVTFVLAFGEVCFFTNSHTFASLAALFEATTYIFEWDHLSYFLSFFRLFHNQYAQDMDLLWGPVSYGL